MYESPVPAWPLIGISPCAEDHRHHPVSQRNSICCLAPAWTGTGCFSASWYCHAVLLLCYIYVCVCYIYLYALVIKFGQSGLQKAAWIVCVFLSYHWEDLGLSTPATPLRRSPLPPFWCTRFSRAFCPLFLQIRPPPRPCSARYLKDVGMKPFKAYPECI